MKKQNKKRKSNELVVVPSDQGISISSTTIRGNITFKFQGEEISNHFLERFILATRIVFNKVPKIYQKTVVVSNCYFNNSKLKT